MWNYTHYLKHKRENRRITCRSHRECVIEFYRQWRDADGSIPWTIEYGP